MFVIHVPFGARTLGNSCEKKVIMKTRGGQTKWALDVTMDELMNLTERLLDG